ncbi:MAG: hypothetical protein Ct9H300mP23_07870 [Nitrospinota bacterium]|nr:MAG: hypothetical protein Ct9H300mP23_07870 [Nitrospinota bacterium]
MSGIQERRFWDKGVFPSEVATIAGKKAIENSGINSKDIGCSFRLPFVETFLNLQRPR